MMWLKNYVCIIDWCDEKGLKFGSKLWIHTQPSLLHGRQQHHEPTSMCVHLCAIFTNPREEVHNYWILFVNLLLKLENSCITVVSTFRHATFKNSSSSSSFCSCAQDLSQYVALKFTCIYKTDDDLLKIMSFLLNHRVQHISDAPVRYTPSVSKNKPYHRYVQIHFPLHNISIQIHCRSNFYKMKEVCPWICFSSILLKLYF